MYATVFYLYKVNDQKETPDCVENVHCTQHWLAEPGYLTWNFF